MKYYEETTIESFVKIIREQYFIEIWIIDRENAGQIEKSMGIDEDRLWIEVVNKDNRNLARGPFIVADSNRKDAADTVLTILIYEICKYKFGKILLVTKDHFGTTLHEIINKLFGQKMECIEPKDFIQKTNVGNSVS
jgi:hypothetical protein